jgi:glutamate formiminotransferase
MTQDEIIEMARESGLETQDGFSESVFYFAKLIAEREREACAKIAEKEYQDAKTIEETHYKYSDAPFNPRQFGLNMDLVNQSKYLSFAIRARGQA